MKTTGIIRRVDDLGRIVIPKEMRRIFKIREGDPMELFVTQEGILFKKYSPVGELANFAKEYAETLFESTGYVTLISDRDTIIGGYGQRDCLDKEIGDTVELWLDKRKSVLHTERGEYEIIKGNKTSYSSFVIAPIISYGEPVGSVIIFSEEDNDQLGIMELKMAETAASFLAKQVE